MIKTTSNIQNFNNKVNLNFKGVPQVKVCGIHDKPSILSTISAARDTSSRNLTLGFLLGITHASNEKVATEDAPELIKFARENAYSMGVPVKLACVTHLTDGRQLNQMISQISQSTLDGEDGLRHKAEQAKEVYGYDDTQQLAKEPIFDCIQIHDNMPVQEIGKVKEANPDSTVLKAVHVPKKGEAYQLDTLVGNAIELAEAPCIDGLLLDSSNLAANQIGGTGLTNNWSVAREIIDTVHDRTGKPVALAGGLNPDNISQALTQTHADMADANSGFRMDRKGSQWKPLNSNQTGPKDYSAVRASLESVKSFDTPYNIYRD